MKFPHQDENFTLGWNVGNKGTFSLATIFFCTKVKLLGTKWSLSIPTWNPSAPKWILFVSTKMNYTTIFSRHSKVSTEISQICSCVLTAGTRSACSCKVEEGRDRIGWLVNPPNLITPDCDTPRGSASHGLFPGALWLETYNPTTFSWAWILGSPAHV